MLRWLSLGILLAAPTLAGIGCGGTVSAGPDDLSSIGDADTDPGDTGLHHHDTGHDVSPDVTIDTYVPPDTYVDPGCADAAPITSYECDPWATPSPCPKGQACFPYVDPPAAACEPEHYGAQCFPAGSGRQGAPCDGSGCAGGFVCVISGEGNVCAALCKTGTPGACPEGLVCDPLDVPSFGVCL
jgi:hypothetical protein